MKCKKRSVICFHNPLSIEISRYFEAEIIDLFTYLYQINFSLLSSRLLALFSILSLMFWLHHIALSVENISSSIEWYSKMFWFETEKTFQMPHWWEFVWVNNGIMRLEFFCFPESQKLPEYQRDISTDLRVQWIKHFCFDVENIQVELERLKSLWCIISSELKLGISGKNYFFVSDPTGNLIEIMEK